MLIDANFHIDFSGSRDTDSVLSTARAALSSLGVGHALAVDLPRINQGIQLADYIDAFANNSFFTPIPCLREETEATFEEQLANFDNYGLRMVKVHPRWLGIGYNSPSLAAIVACIKQLNMKLLLCTYPYTTSPGPSSNLHLPSCLQQLSPPDGWPPTVLMHGGGTQFSDVCEWARHQEDVFVDLSFTLTQLFSSSVRLDLFSALQRFDQRIVVGSDAPYEDTGLWRSNLSELTATCGTATRRRVEGENILAFLEL